MCMHVCHCTLHMCVLHCILHLWNTESGIRHLGAGVTDAYQLPDMGIGNQTQILLELYPVLLTTETSL